MELPDAPDIVRLTRLLHELCEMGDDAYAWRSRLFSVLLSMLDADKGACYVMKHPIDPTDIGPRMPMSMYFAVNGTFVKYVEQGDLTSNPITPAMMARMGTDFTSARQELIDDATWYDSAFVRDVARPSNWDQMINSQVAISPPNYVNGLGIMRDVGKPAFTAREVRIVHFIHGELARLWRRPDPIGIHTLPKRQREVLEGLRQGLGRKQIAAKLQLSEHTVHGYTKELFKRAKVNSQGELLASLSQVIRPNLLP